MRLAAIALPLIFAASSAGYGQEAVIHKCVDTGGTAYSDAPCQSQQREAPPPVGTGRKVASLTTSVGTSSVRVPRPDPVPLTSAPLSATRIFIGMTDTQVLNLSQWGRPAQIKRSREGHIWRETWTYVERETGQPRQFLYFENARLVAQEDPDNQRSAEGAQDQAPTQTEPRLTVSYSH
jgi:YD repeat-containing protein